MMNLFVNSAGVISSVGHDLPSTAAAVRAGVDNFQETNFIDYSGEAIAAARIERALEAEHKDHVRAGEEQLVEWVLQVIEECLVPIKISSQDPILLILIDSSTVLPVRAGYVGLLGTVYKACHDRLKTADNTVEIKCYSNGAAGTAAALQTADNWLEGHTDGKVIIAGIDSWLNTPRINYALQNDRILTQDKASGFIPGEAAAAILLSRNSTPGEASLQIKGCGHASETASLHNESEVCFGIGLADATRKALEQASLQVHDIHLRLLDVSGEEYFFNEAAYAWGRLLRQSMPTNYEMLHPATKLGEIGAAFGPLLLAYALHLTRIQRHPGTHTLMQLSSHESSRTAIVAVKAEI